MRNESFLFNISIRRICCVLLLFCSLLAKGINIPENYTVTYFSAKNGVEDGFVNDIIQDKKGLLWFATWNGLYRFDGYTFKNYKSNTEDKNGLTNDRILYIDEDQYGCIWVQCYDSTAYRFNPRNEVFEPISIDPSCKIRSIKVLPDGHTWLLREDGKAIRVWTDAADLRMKIKVFSVPPIPDKTSRAVDIQSAFMDSEQKEWLLTDNGLYLVKGDHLSAVIPPANIKENKVKFCAAREVNKTLLFGANGGRVYRFSLSGYLKDISQLETSASVISIIKLRSQLVYVTNHDGFFIQEEGMAALKHINLNGLAHLSDKTIQTAKATRNGLLWLSHPVPGVTLYDSETGKLSFFEGKDENGNPPHTETGFFLIEAPNGILWVHPNGGGFSYYDPHQKTLVPFNTTDKEVKWKSNDRCFAAFADRQGNLWMSTQLDRLKRITCIPEKFHIYTPDKTDVDMPQNEIRALYIDSENRIWTGTRDQHIYIYNNELSLLHSLSIDRVYAIMQDSHKEFWVSTKGMGVKRVTESSPGKFSMEGYSYNSKDPYSISNNNIYYAFEDSKKRIWIATYGGGLNLAERKSDGSYRFINYRNQLKQYPIDRFYKVRHITEDESGYIWVSTTAGILLFDGNFSSPEQIAFHVISREQGNANSLSNNDVQMVKCMRSGKVFAITYGGGLNELVRTGKYSFVCKNFVRQSGLISDIIYSMQEDSEGNLWLATGGGLVKFITDREQIQYPIEHIAFNVHFSEGVGAMSRNRIFFGTYRGLFYFNPQKIAKSNFIPRIFFSSIWVNNTELTPKQNSSVLTATLDNMSSLELPPHNHSLRLEFAALDMTDTEYIQYAYMLEGFDKTYRVAGKGHEADYTNLPPGDYKFKIKSTNNEGVWVDNERTLRIYVKPSFNETWLARILYITGGVFLALLIVYIYIVFYKMKTKVKTEEYITQLKLNFFTNISHELRTPLTLIAGPLSLVLKNEHLSEKAKEALSIVKKNSDRMQRLIGQILDISKIQDRKMRLRIRQTDIVKFVGDVTHYFDGLAEERGIELTFSSSLVSFYLWIDLDHIEKVIFNLLSNAFKYTGNGKHICVRITDDGDYIVIAISDEGVGIPTDKIGMIFNRYENLVQGNVSTPWESSGIGLALAKELVEMHRGNISVESEVGKGSTFFVRLLKGMSHYPSSTEFMLEDLPSDTISESPDLPVEAEAAKDHESRLLMLIVEDNKELRSFIKQVFETRFRYIEAENGQEGAEKAVQYLPDIILTDLMMPVKDGIEMLRELRGDERTSHIPAIILTAKTDMDSVVTGIETGADDYVTKPFSVNYLQAKVDSLLAQRAKLQAYYCNHNSSSVEEGDEYNELQISEKDRTFLKRLADIMKEEMDNSELSIDDLVSAFSLSRTNFFRKLKSLTGLSPVMYIKEKRMQRAAELIKTKQYSMAEIAYMVGYSDPHYFSKCFKSFWGVNATEYNTKL